MEGEERTVNRNSIIAILTAGIVLSGGAGVYYVQSSHQKDVGKETQQGLSRTLMEKINADDMYQTIEKLSKQPREAGTDGELQAVKYIEKEFKTLGYKTEIQAFPIYNYKINHVSVKMGTVDLGETPIPFTGDSGGVVTAPLVYVGKAQPWEINAEIKGKIALVERGDLSFIDKVKNLLNKGAAGVLMYNNLPSDPFTGQLANDQSLPAVGITREKGLELVELLKTKEITATIDADVEKIETKSYNVIASRKPEKKDDTGQIVTIGAHHDSVPAGPGANDDASGVSAVLELARIFAKTPIDTEIRFLTFGSEERGLLGSYYYAEHLPKSDVNRIKAHFQLDMIGASAAGSDHPAGGLIMYTIDGRKNLVTDLAAVAGKQMLSEVIPYGKSGRSDHQPFHELGIPTALFIHAPVEPDYHKPTDTIDKISKEKLVQVAKVIGSAVYQIAGPETPKLEKTKEVSATINYPFENRNLE